MILENVRLVLKMTIIQNIIPKEITDGVNVKMDSIGAMKENAKKIDCEAKKKGTVWNAAKHQCECPTGERWDWDHHKCEAVVCKIPGTVFDEMSKHCECPKFHHLCPKKGSHKHHAHASNDTTV